MIVHRSVKGADPIAEDSLATTASRTKRTVTCLEHEHIRALEESLSPELHKHLLSDEFISQCNLSFRSADVDESGFLEMGRESGQIAKLVLEVLPEVFLDRLDGMRAENIAVCFDSDWDGKMSPTEFAGFVRWAAAMQARGFLRGESSFEVVGNGRGGRLLVISEFLDEDGTLNAAVADGVDLAVYNPSGVTCREFGQHLRASKEYRQQQGLALYSSVALANHGPDGDGVWTPFAGRPLDLRKTKDVQRLLPVFVALASLLQDGGRLDLLACNLASAPGGMDFIKRLEKETGRTVCASADATGNAKNGGNWQLEVGDVNVASDYFDEEKLKHFERLMATPQERATARAKGPIGLTHRNDDSDLDDSVQTATSDDSS